MSRWLVAEVNSKLSIRSKQAASEEQLRDLQVILNFLLYQVIAKEGHDTEP
ncbi:MAG TPA: hypothetical protein VFA71_12225 [Terriglobales bacterium]|nr:hypothetical protein [Terriglobales bacterium]